MSLGARAVLFDLDGTLLDTLADLGESMNTALAALGMPPHPLDRYRIFVGDGMRNLASRALPADRRDPAIIENCVAAMLRIYGERWDRRTRPYPGILDLLGALAARGVGCAVLSNKPDDLTQAMVERYFGRGRFAVVAGARSGVARKPDPDAALAIADHMRLPAGEVLYLGDTDTDMRTATAAGMIPVGAAWGFRAVEELRANGAREIVHTPAGVLELVA